MADVRWNMGALGRLIGTAPEVVAEVEAATTRIREAASAMSSGYRTGYYHPDHKSPGVGNTQPEYEGNVEMQRSSVVGIVYTGNYAAMKDNAENNTLLKARG